MKFTGCGKWKQPVKGKKSDTDLTEKKVDSRPQPFSSYLGHEIYAN